MHRCIIGAVIFSNQARYTACTRCRANDIVNRSLIKITNALPVCLARNGIARPRHAAAVTFLNIRS
jgi:hypothetical protein